MKTKKLKKYIIDLDGLIANSTEDIKLIAMITSRLEEIVGGGSKKELKHFVCTLTKMRDFAWTASDYKFLDKVVNRLKEIV